MLYKILRPFIPILFLIAGLILTDIFFLGITKGHLFIFLTALKFNTLSMKYQLTPKSTNKDVFK